VVASLLASSRICNRATVKQHRIKPPLVSRVLAALKRLVARDKASRVMRRGVAHYKLGAKARPAQAGRAAAEGALLLPDDAHRRLRARDRRSHVSARGLGFAMLHPYLRTEQRRQLSDNRPAFVGCLVLAFDSLADVLDEINSLIERRT
jgi:hypothetical protein